MRLARSLLVIAVCLAGSAPPAGGEEYFGSTYAAGGLTAGSTWEAILKTPRVYFQSPLIGVGGTIVTLPLLCARGDALETPGPGPRGVVTNVPRTHLVSVYRLPPGFLLNGAPTFLFQKTWQIQPCTP